MTHCTTQATANARTLHCMFWKVLYTQQAHWAQQQASTCCGMTKQQLQLRSGAATLMRCRWLAAAENRRGCCRQEVLTQLAGLQAAGAEQGSLVGHHAGAGQLVGGHTADCAAAKAGKVSARLWLGKDVRLPRSRSSMGAYTSGRGPGPRRPGRSAPAARRRCTWPWCLCV
jgi:hypothetical protein